MMVFDYVLSAASLISLWLMGNRWKYAPLVGVGSQVLWFYYIYLTGHWGLLPGVIAYTLVQGRNAWKWLKEAQTRNQGAV